jgi:hypothetical protein
MVTPATPKCDRDRGIVLERRVDRLDDMMAVDAEDAAQISSARKPFITAMTTMSVATPSMMPRKEIEAMTEITVSLRRERR